MFRVWRANDVSVWDLNDKINEYHDEIARTLYSSYTINNPIFSVAFGIANGVLTIDEVEESCRERVKGLSVGICLCVIVFENKFFSDDFPYGHASIKRDECLTGCIDIELGGKYIPVEVELPSSYELRHAL